MELGLTSVTFRGEEYETVIDYCVKSGLSCIEWGSDIHVPETDLDKARAVRKASDKAGIRICSYGSYYNLCANENCEEAFLPYLETAVILGAPIIRLWAGKVGSNSASKEYYAQAVIETQKLCDMAAKYNITLAFEYHRNSLSDNADSAIRIYKDINRKNFGLYYQQSLQCTLEENIAALEKMLPYIKMVHVFYYENKMRMSLGDGEGIDFWTRVIALLREHQIHADLLFEFLKDASLEGLKCETDIVKKIK